MKAPTKRFPSNRIDMPRQKLENVAIYKALNEGSRLFREQGFSLTLKPRSDRPTNRLYVSAMYKCGRLLWLELNAPNVLKEKPLDVLNTPDNWRTSHMGDISEAYIVRLLTLGGIKVYNQQKRVSDFNDRMSGRIDGMFQIGAQKESLLEIKALKHDKVVELNNYGVRIAIPHYYEQMQTYMHYLELEQGYLVVLDADTRQFYIEKVKYDATTVDWIKHKAKAILEAEVVRQIPEHVVERDCFFCPARHLCEKMDKGQFDLLYEEYQNKIDAQYEAVRKGKRK